MEGEGKGEKDEDEEEIIHNLCTSLTTQKSKNPKNI